MKRLILIIIAIFSLTSCAKERFGDTYSEALDVKLHINTRAVGTNGEDAINKVRIITIASNGLMIFNSVVTPTPNPSGIDEYALTTFVGENDFYVICNEDAALTAKLGAVKTERDIENATFNYTSPVKAPFVMVGHVKGMVKSVNNMISVDFIRADGTEVTNADRLIVDVKRITAKVSLSFIKVAEAQTDFEISNLQATIGQMPKYGYIGTSMQYKENTWLSDYLLTQKSTSSTSLSTDGTGTFNSDTKEFDITGDHIDMEDFYIPEHYLAKAGNPENSTYILVTADAKVATQTYKVNWRINIDNEGNYDVIRNTHYKILGRISGLGAVGLHAEIKMATVHDITVDWELLDGLIIVSDKKSDYGKSVDAWNDYNNYSGILKINSNNVCSDVVFKRGSVVGIGTKEMTFQPSEVLWTPSTFTSTITDFQSIPYLPSSEYPEGNPNTKEQIAAGLGDPCKLVRLSPLQISSGIVDNKQWHMATYEEMNRLRDGNDKQNPTFVKDKRGYSAFHSLLIPNNFFRYGILGQLRYWGDTATEIVATPGAVSTTASYWVQSGVFFKTTPDHDAWYTTTTLTYANSIRCIRNSPMPLSALELVGGSVVAYGGGNGYLLLNATNVPFWTVELVGGSAPVSEHVDFSLTPSITSQGGTSVHKVTGVNPQRLYYYIARKENAYPKTRSFQLRISGVGTDGVKHNKVHTVSQSGYRWWANIQKLDASVLVNGMIPKAGKTFTITVNVGPNDIPMLTDKTYTVSVYANSNGTNIPGVPPAQNIIPGVYQYTFQFPFPANTLPDVRNVTIGSTSNLPSATSTANSYYQNNK